MKATKSHAKKLPKTLLDPKALVDRSLKKRRKRAPAASPKPKPLEDCAKFRLRPYQMPIFRDHSTGVVVLHWSRQIGKSYTLAAWAVERLIRFPGRLVTVLSNSRENGADLPRSEAGFRVSRVTRTEAHGLGLKIFDPLTREEISPEAARAAALDKRAYDQNYECAFADENLTLLSHGLISGAERNDVGFICEQDWNTAIVRPRGGISREIGKGSEGGQVMWLDEETAWRRGAVEASKARNEFPASRETGCLEFLRRAVGPLYVGFDVGRKVDLSVITVVEKLGEVFFVRAILRMRDLRLPEQQLRLGEICRLPNFRRAAIDMTGLGLGLFEYAQNEFGASRIHGINFATTVPATRAIALEGRKREAVRVTESLALELLQCYEDRRIQHPIDRVLRDDLRKPERVTTPGGRVSIAATRDEAGHADHFWSLALALEAAASGWTPFAFESIKIDRPMFSNRSVLI